jgi:GTP-binding protein LepA
MLRFKVPLSEIISDFFDKLKSITKGYGSMDFELAGY